LLAMRLERGACFARRLLRHGEQLVKFCCKHARFVA
jgi:hypothetical protein